MLALQKLYAILYYSGHGLLQPCTEKRMKTPDLIRALTYTKSPKKLSIPNTVVSFIIDRNELGTLMISDHGC